MISEPDRPTDDGDGSDSEQGRNPLGQFKTGFCGNPAGRPPGIRDRRHIVNDLLEAYRRKGGVDYLVELPPDQFNGLLKHVIPREVDLGVTQVSSRDVAEQLVAMRQRGGGNV